MNIIKTANFAKINALGNEIIVLDIKNKQVFDKVFKSFLKQDNIYFEQMMVIYENHTENYDFDLCIYNNNGSLAGACGNGMRALMQYIYYKYSKKNATFCIEGRILSAEYIDDNHIIVNMGQPQFDSASLGLSSEVQNMNNVILDSDLPPASLVSVGNPHAIFFLNDLHTLNEIKIKGAQLERHSLFKNRCNISFAVVEKAGYIKLRTWERDAGLTKACGSASCATHIAAFNKNLTSEKSTIELLGGILNISWKPNYDIIMEGASKIEFFGIVNLNNYNIEYE